MWHIYSNFAYEIDICSNFCIVLHSKCVKNMLRLLKGYKHLFKLPNAWKICWNLAIINDLPFATQSLPYSYTYVFLYLFSLKNSRWFLTKMLLVAMGWLHSQIQLFQSGSNFISKRCSYLKVRHNSNTSCLSIILMLTVMLMMEFHLLQWKAMIIILSKLSELFPNMLFLNLGAMSREGSAILKKIFKISSNENYSLLKKKKRNLTKSKTKKDVTNVAKKEKGIFLKKWIRKGGA